jgi:hypothetical protein
MPVLFDLGATSLPGDLPRHDWTILSKPPGCDVRAGSRITLRCDSVANLERPAAAPCTDTFWKRGSRLPRHAWTPNVCTCRCTHLLVQTTNPEIEKRCRLPWGALAGSIVESANFENRYTQMLIRIWVFIRIWEPPLSGVGRV